MAAYPPEPSALDAFACLAKLLDEAHTTLLAKLRHRMTATPYLWICRKGCTLYYTDLEEEGGGQGGGDKEAGHDCNRQNGVRRNGGAGALPQNE